MFVHIPDTHHHSIDKDGNVLNEMTNHILKQWDNVKTHYLTVTISEFGKSTNRTVHSILALMFIPNPENKRTVNHIDGNKHNNSLDNLEWNTDSENVQHAYDHKLNHQNSKLTKEQIKTIFDRFMNHENFTVIRNDYDISPAQISYWINKYVKENHLEEEYKTELKYQKDRRQCKQYRPQRLSERSTPK